MKKELQDALRSLSNNETTCHEILQMLEQTSPEAGTDAVDDNEFNTVAHYSYSATKRGRRSLMKKTLGAAGCRQSTLMHLVPDTHDLDITNCMFTIAIACASARWLRTRHGRVRNPRDV